jgi:hypothetical protein
MRKTLICFSFCLFLCKYSCLLAFGYNFLYGKACKNKPSEKTTTTKTVVYYADFKKLSKIRRLHQLDDGHISAKNFSELGQFNLVIRFRPEQVSNSFHDDDVFGFSFVVKSGQVN